MLLFKILQYQYNYYKYHTIYCIVFEHSCYRNRYRI